MLRPVLELRTEAEARFEAKRRRLGQILAPLAFVGMYALPLPGLTAQAHALAAITSLTVLLWITEAIPLAAAALLAPALAVLLGVTDATDALAPLASPLIFLFMGGFMLALALAEQGLDRRAALWLLGRRWVAGSPARASASIAIATYLMSMWISNTATTAMMIPVALGLCRTIRAAAPVADQPRFDRHAEGMLLGLTYAASLGGIATPVGTAPNVIALGMLESQLHLRIDFFQWMSFALPTSAVTLGVVLLYAAWRFPSPIARLGALADNVEAELARLGPMSAGERRAAAVFMLAVVGWLTPAVLKLSLGPAHAWTAWANGGLDEGVVALLCGVLLCLLPSGKGDGKPVLAWERAMQLDWSTLLLLGGGLSLGKLMFETGLAKAMAGGALAAVGRGRGHGPADPGRSLAGPALRADHGRVLRRVPRAALRPRRPLPQVHARRTRGRPPVARASDPARPRGRQPLGPRGHHRSARRPLPRGADDPPALARRVITTRRLSRSAGAAAAAPRRRR